jgi:hypothetical protein
MIVSLNFDCLLSRMERNFRSILDHRQSTFTETIIIASEPETWGKDAKQINELVHCVGYCTYIVQDARSTKYKIQKHYSFISQGKPSIHHLRYKTPPGHKLY